jgi:hypothetical protein
VEPAGGGAVGMGKRQTTETLIELAAIRLLLR